MLVGMSIVLLSWGQRRLNRPSRLWQGWAGASYVAYIIQPLVGCRRIPGQVRRRRLPVHRRDLCRRRHHTPDPAGAQGSGV